MDYDDGPYTEGPLGDAPAGLDVAVSDTAILIVSLVGFGLLTAIVYKLIVMRVQSREEFEKTEAQQMDYEDHLDQADPATLNRAQRRARAKFIMKRQRRIPVPELDENGDLINAQEVVEDGDEPVVHLSRKERQKAAKAAEREERRLFEEERREMQRDAQAAAQREKKERERLAAERMEEKRKLRLQEKEAREQAEYQEWVTFLSHGKDAMTVQEFAEHMKQHKSVSIDELADRFRTPSKQVRARIRQLVASCRLTGVVDSDRFVYITDEEMKAVAAFIRERDEVTLHDLSKETHRLVQLQG